MHIIDDNLRGHGIYKIKFEDGTEYYLYIRKTHKLSDCSIIELFLKTGIPDKRFVFNKLSLFKYIIQKHINEYNIETIILVFNDEDDGIINKKIKAFSRYINNDFEIIYSDNLNINLDKSEYSTVHAKKLVIIKKMSK